MILTHTHTLTDRGLLWTTNSISGMKNFPLWSAVTQTPIRLCNNADSTAITQPGDNHTCISWYLLKKMYLLHLLLLLLKYLFQSRIHLLVMTLSFLKTDYSAHEAEEALHWTLHLMVSNNKDVVGRSVVPLYWCGGHNQRCWRRSWRLMLSLPCASCSAEERGTNAKKKKKSGSNAMCGVRAPPSGDKEDKVWKRGMK